MKKISQGVQNLMEKHLSSDISKKWQGLNRRLDSQRKIKIANTGLVSSGKSSLFNALIDSDISNPRFAIGAARTTSCQDVEEFNDRTVLADTPGIDVNDEDNLTALESVLESDIILIIHNIKLGALTAAEFNWVKSIAENMQNEEERKSRLMFIISWIDERDAQPDYRHTVDETLGMVRDAVGCDIDSYEVSVKRYITGKEKGKEVLISKSNVPDVKKAIIKKAERYAVISEKLAEAELKSLCDISINELKNKSYALEEKKTSITQEIMDTYDMILKAWDSALETFRRQYNIVKEKLQEMNNI